LVVIHTQIVKHEGSYNGWDFLAQNTPFLSHELQEKSQLSENLSFPPRLSIWASLQLMLPFHIRNTLLGCESSITACHLSLILDGGNINFFHCYTGFFC